MRPLYLRHVLPFWREHLDAGGFRRDLKQLLDLHFTAVDPLRPWGWKNPSSLYLLPLLDRALPGLRFIHMIRHGLDMATSANQNPLRKYGEAILGAGRHEVPQPLASALLWARANTLAADYGSSRMDRRYFLLRYEDLCAEPTRTLDKLAAFLKLPVPKAGWCTPIRHRAPRWQALEPTLRERLVAEIGPVLRRFGYSC